MGFGVYLQLCGLQGICYNLQTGGFFFFFVVLFDMVFLIVLGISLITAVLQIVNQS